MRRNKMLYSMIVTAVLLAIGLMMPSLTGRNPAFGKLVSPMHIPVFICGLTCGWAWGAGLGVCLPLLGMAMGAPQPPMALPMTYELCAYGLLTGLLYPLAVKRWHMANYPAMLVTLVVAMVAGRFVGGAAKALLLTAGVIQGVPLTFAMFVASYFADTMVGAAIHLVVVPAVVLALEKARLAPVLYT